MSKKEIHLNFIELAQKKILFEFCNFHSIKLDSALQAHSMRQPQKGWRLVSACLPQSQKAISVRKKVGEGELVRHKDPVAV